MSKFEGRALDKKDEKQTCRYARRRLCAAKSGRRREIKAGGNAPEEAHANPPGARARQDKRSEAARGVPPQERGGKEAGDGVHAIGVGRKSTKIK